MTEQEWQSGAEPDPMLAFLRRKVSGRRLRLFACACCRGLWRLLEDPRSRDAVAAAERDADGEGADAERRAARWAAQVARSSVQRPSRRPARAAYETTHLDAWEAAHYTHIYCNALGHSEQCRLLRDIFGNPFRPVVLNPAWLTDTAVAIARQMYASRDFGAMPILADALQDAGCDNPDVLDHCRGAGPHVRGCWVVDLVLGKS